MVCLTTGLDCAGDYSMTFELKLYLPRGLHPLRCVIQHAILMTSNHICHMFNTYVLDGHKAKNSMQLGSIEPKRPWNVGLYSRGSCLVGHWHYSLLQGLLQTKHTSFHVATFNNAKVTTNQYEIWHQCSPRHSKFFSAVAFASTFDALLHTCYTQRALLAHHKLMVHIRPCSLCIVHSFTFTSMQGDDEMQLIIRQLINVTKFTGWKSCDRNKL